MSNKVTALSFDASGISPESFSLLPGGWYPMSIEDAEVKATRGKSGGTRAEFVFVVTGGEHQGRKIFGGINVKNANPQAQEIGQRELSAICHAVGIINVTDLAAFKGRQLQVKVKKRIATDEEKDKGYEDRNEPCGFKALEGAAPSAPGAPSGPPPLAGGAPPPPPQPPAPPAPPAPAAVFPPEGWQANPNAPGWFWNAATGEQLQEADLRAKFPAPVAAPAAPPQPPAPPAPPAPPQPPAPPVVQFPPAGWKQHPNDPAWFFEEANPANMKTEADLRASMAPAAPAGGPPAPPAPAAAGSPPPWKAQG